MKNRKTFKKTKKTVRVSQTKGYESDSELSVPDDFDVTTKRPSRSAAKVAAQRLSASSKNWVGKGNSDSDEFSSNYSSDDDNSDESSAPMCTIIPTKERSNRANNETDDSSSDDDSESEDRSAFIRSRKRQKIALSMVKQNMKKAPMSKKKGGKGQEKSFGRKKKTKKKTPVDESSDSDDGDPLNGIDMVELKEKAMEGCRLSVLHSISWWRIVLDEAHNIK